MKKLIPYIVPIVIWTFLIVTTESVCGQRYRQNTNRISYKRDLRPAPIVTTNSISTTNVSIFYSDSWAGFEHLTDIDLSQAVLNPETGRYELYLEIEMDESETGMLFFDSIATETIVTTTTVSNNRSQTSFVETNSVLLSPPLMSFQILSNAPPVSVTGNLVAPQCGVGGIIVGIIVLVVGIIIIYLLIKLCKRLLPPPPDNP